MTNLTRYAALLLATAGFAFAGGQIVPEINGATAAGALALLSGAVLVLRGRRKR